MSAECFCYLFRASGDGVGGHLFVRTGVVNRSRSFAFETMVWRVSRGNIYFRTVPNDKMFEDPANSVSV